MTRKRKPKRRYTDAEKAAALEVYKTDGPRETSRKTGIPARTISRWAASAGMSTDVITKTEEATAAAKAQAALRRAELQDRMVDVAHELLDRVDKPHIEFKVVGGSREEPGRVEAVTYPTAPAGAVKDLMTSVGILVDKIRLEAGEPTGHERHDLHINPQRALDEGRERLRQLSHGARE